MDERVRRGGGVAAWRQIADAIEEDLRSGALAPGARLAPEPQLAQRFGVNRHTVRRAVAALAARGLVRVAHGRGAFVEQAPIAYLIGARTRFSEIVSGAGREAGGEIVSSAVVEADEAVAARLGIPPGAPALTAEFRRFVDGLPFSHGRTFLPLPRFARFVEAFGETGSITGALAACGVPDYRRLWTDIGARLSTAEDAASLDVAPGRILFVVESVDVDLSGAPVQATTTLFPADRTTVRIES